MVSQAKTTALRLQLFSLLLLLNVNLCFRITVKNEVSSVADRVASLPDTPLGPCLETIAQTYTTSFWILVKTPKVPKIQQMSGWVFGEMCTWGEPFDLFTCGPFAREETFVVPCSKTPPASPCLESNRKTFSPAPDCSVNNKLLPDSFIHLPSAVFEEAGAVALRAAVET